MICQRMPILQAKPESLAALYAVQIIKGKSPRCDTIPPSILPTAHINSQQSRESVQAVATRYVVPPLRAARDISTAIQDTAHGKDQQARSRESGEKQPRRQDQRKRKGGVPARCRIRGFKTTTQYAVEERRKRMEGKMRANDVRQDEGKMMYEGKMRAR